ncbi:MAG: peroxide stress protein YaaA [Crocinitomicaceae bacterium]
MKIILSPAKSINFDIENNTEDATQPIFLDESAYLVNKLQKLSARQIAKLMTVSTDIANLNKDRFQSWEVPFTRGNSKPAADIFTGAAYQGLEFPKLTKKQRLVGQEKLRILSGLYGLLKPLDLIQPYRLEMGTSFKVTPKVKNLYLFWGDKILKQLNEELKNDVNPLLVNLASSEYFKAAKLNDISAPVITPIFKDLSKSGDYKMIMTFAKKARGLMTRYIITENINDLEGLKGFDAEGYYFYPQESTDKDLVFRRE